MSTARNQLALLRTAEAQRRQLENRVTYHAIEARRHGASWGDIARALGITKQAAQKRYDRRLF